LLDITSNRNGTETKSKQINIRKSWRIHERPAIKLFNTTNIVT